MRLLLACLLACLLAGPAFADEAGTVTTHATARDRLPNTVADVSLGVDVRGRTLGEVQAALAVGSTKLSAYLKSVAAERTRTQAVQIEPVLEQNPARGQAAGIVGYAGHIAVEFRFDADKVGPILTESLNQGANTIKGTTMRPREAELDAARQRLAAEATRMALTQARTVAEAAGRRVGSIRSIVVEDAALAGGPRMLLARAAAPVAAEAGDSEISASVTLSQSLIEP